MHPPYQQIQLTPNVVARNYFTPSSPTTQITVPLSSTTRLHSRGARANQSFPYHPTRASSSPIPSVSPSDTLLHACGWINDDGTFCMESISRLTVSDHLITHGITNMEHDRRISCRWVGCRLRGGKGEMKRESIVRHVREKHLQCRRGSN